MAIRVSVQADDEDECVEGLARLVDAGFQPVMMPRLMTDDRWMARAVPAPTVKAPAGDGRGPAVSG
ncbi:hypothetical protein ABZX63_33310 [Streptomyces tendae]|uniref:hypothetical protein n=1 Tax=Streptomyces tendae TaxID=1932 RepID=UPI0033A56D64